MTTRAIEIDADRKAFVTPEGVDLRLRVATYIERASAFCIDAGIILGLLLILTIAEAILFSQLRFINRQEGWAFIAITWMLGAFVLRNLYFVLFEQRPTGATPGKRIMGLRVVARDGGRLTGNAVIARNAMREIELFLPVMFLFQRGQGVDGMAVALGVLWSGVFLVFPLFNRERLRLGDMAAGAMVIAAPKTALRIDLASAGASGDLRFTTAQLDAYGIKELHVLEEVLHGSDRRTQREVAERIQRKIGWPAPFEGTPRAFLQAYYAGLRDRLEERMVTTGKRRADKFDR